MTSSFDAKDCCVTTAIDAERPGEFCMLVFNGQNPERELTLLLHKAEILKVRERLNQLVELKPEDVDAMIDEMEKKTK